MKKILLSLAVFILVSSCSTIKTIKILKSGEVEQEEFFVQVPFEYRLGLIILKVNVSGEEYDFILDTGAPNVISKKLANKLEIENESEQKVGDSQGENSDLGFATIEKLGIGGINFINTGTAIADLELSKEIACLNIDGFIGANLMKKAIWKFDYQNQLITITNSIDSLNISQLSSKVSFIPQITGVPMIDFKLNEVNEKNVTFDLGSNGAISLSNKTYNTLMKSKRSIPHTYSFGSSSSGLYGVGEKDSTFYAKVPSVSFGDVSLDNTVVSFSGKSSSTIGIKFFENYDVIIDWFEKEILLIKKMEYDNTILSNFGFSFSNENNSLVVSNIYEKMEELKLGDQIIEIDGVSYDKLTPEKWCEVIENSPIKNKDEIRIRVLRDGKELSFKLEKVKLL